MTNVLHQISQKDTNDSHLDNDSHLNQQNTKKSKKRKLSEFENVTLFLTMFFCTSNSDHKIGLTSERIHH